MTDDQNDAPRFDAGWERLDDIFQTALDTAPEARAGYVERACGDDEGLRREIESLLANAGDDPRLEQASMGVAALWMSETGEDLSGRTLGRWEIQSLLGSGGMGQVYLAKDTTLGRLVALKMLGAFSTANPTKARRFEEEARAASALNHPNIITIHEVGRDADRLFIVAEHIDGETLRARLERGPMTLEHALDLSTQITGALAAAHRAGLVHRDIKPENIMIRRDGYVKIVDFGIAKFTDRDTEGAGVVAGTDQYMSPEQAAGQAVDARSDLYSFGIVLHEMLAGTRPQPEGPNASIDPAPLRRIVHRLLSRRPEDRGDSATLQTELRDIARRRERRGSRRIALAAAVVAAAGLGIALVVALRRGPLPGAAEGADRAEYVQLTEQSELEEFPTLSPDGQVAVYGRRVQGRWQLFEQPIGQAARPFLASAGTDDFEPAFSPDGRQIAFRSSRDGGGVFVADRTDPRPRRVTTFGYNPSWSPDGRSLVIATEDIHDPTGRYSVSSLFVVDVGSGATTKISTHDAVQPAWSPHGQRIAYWWSPSGQRDLWTVRPDGTDPVRLTDDVPVDWNPIWSPDGRHLYWSSDRGGGGMNVWRAPIDEASGRFTGPPEPATMPSPYAMHFSFDRHGRRLAYVQMIRRLNIARLDFDPATGRVVGAPTNVLATSRPTTGPDLSPDARLVVDSQGTEQEDLLIADADGSNLRKLTNDAFKDRAPAWSPDGEWIAFFSNRSGKNQLWLIKPDGSGLHQVTATTGRSINTPIWAPDSRRLAYHQAGRTFILDPFRAWDAQVPQPIPQVALAGHWTTTTSWSPDGLKLAGALQGGPAQDGIDIYDFTSGRHTTVAPHGVSPMWLGDSRRILFVHDSDLLLLDTASGQSRTLISFAPRLLGKIAVSRDNRRVYLETTSTESDVWIRTVADR